MSMDDVLGTYPSIHQVNTILPKNMLSFEKPLYSQHAEHFTEDLKNPLLLSYWKALNFKLYLSQEDLSLFYSHASCL